MHIKAVELENMPQQYSIDRIMPGTKKHLTTIKGIVIENPNDATSPWTIRDYLCKVTITGEFQIPPIKFLDEELESINVLKN
jgi:hypothetical protein